MSDKNEVIVMYDSPEAAQHTTVSGWLSRDGSFWPDTHNDAERMARYCGSTHKRCECGNVHDRHRTLCDACAAKLQRERFMALPAIAFADTDENYLMVFGTDRYFSHGYGIEDYCRENGVSPRDLMVAVPKMNYVDHVDSDSHLGDVLGEDCEPPEELEEAFAVLNAAIDAFNAKEPISWGPECSHRVKFAEAELVEIERAAGLAEVSA